MKIHLLLNHTALIEDDRKPIVTVSPPYAGTLTVEGINYPINPEAYAAMGKELASKINFA